MTSRRSQVEPIKRRSHITLGRCKYRFKNGLECPCTSGKCTLVTILSDDSLAKSRCDGCDHFIELHEEYGEYIPMYPFLHEELTKAFRRH